MRGLSENFGWKIKSNKKNKTKIENSVIMRVMGGINQGVVRKLNNQLED